MADIRTNPQVFRAIQNLKSARRDQLIAVLFLVASSIFLFFDAEIPPVALPDEARNAVNAIEMYISGFSVVTTFNFQPDLWNTKPPLLIWLMSVSMNLFGPSDWAIRLPSALAAIGTLSCTLFFVRRITGSLSMAVGAGTILLLSPGFFGEHGARTGDFDALLTFFTTAGLQLLFFAVHRTRPGMRWMFAIGGLIAAGALTKSIAAFIPVTGVIVYLISVGRLKRVLFASHRYAVAGIVALAPLVIFYLFREAVAAGYMAAVMYNDIVGRFSQSLIEATTPLFYVKELSAGCFVAGPLLVAAPLAYARLAGRTKLLFVYATSIAVTSLAVYSMASSRAAQYALPMFPWLSIMAVLTLRYVIRMTSEARRNGKMVQAFAFAGALVLLCGQIVHTAVSWRYDRFPARQYYPQSAYGTLFAELSARGVTQLTVVDAGIPHLGKPGYAPLLRWNRLVWQDKGMKIEVEDTVPGAAGPLIASCEPLVFRQWRGPGLEKDGRCATLWPGPGYGRPAAQLAAR